MLAGLSARCDCSFSRSSSPVLLGGPSLLLALLGHGTSPESGEQAAQFQAQCPTLPAHAGVRAIADLHLCPFQNKVVGIVGAGRIGTAYARMMVEGHKCDLVYYDPYPNKFLEEYVR